MKELGVSQIFSVITQVFGYRAALSKIFYCPFPITHITVYFFMRHWLPHVAATSNDITHILH